MQNEAAAETERLAEMYRQAGIPTGPEYVKAEAVAIIRWAKRIQAQGIRYSNEDFDMRQAMLSLVTCPWRW